MITDASHDKNLIKVEFQKWFQKLTKNIFRIQRKSRNLFSSILCFFRETNELWIWTINIIVWKRSHLANFRNPKNWSIFARNRSISGRKVRSIPNSYKKMFLSHKTKNWGFCPNNLVDNFSNRTESTNKTFYFYFFVF